MAASMSADIQKQVARGKNYIATKDYEKAEDVFLKVLKTHKLADVYNALGLVYADRGKFNFAEIAFKRALAINPNYMEAALNLSVIYNNLGLSRKSKEIYQKLKKYGAASRGAKDPMLMAKIANMHAEVGDLYHGVGEYDEAIAEYEKAVDLCPHFIDVQTKLGTCFREKGEASKSIKHFKRFEKKATRYAPYWVALGVTYYAANKMKEAKKAWQRALGIEPKNKLALAYSKLAGSK
jgi:tetratricopeptide (TPR) repeat protein